MKCNRCNGTGYRSAAKEMGMEDYPQMQRPIGIWRCDSCGGSGKAFNASAMFEEYKKNDPEGYAKWTRDMHRMLKRLKKKNNLTG